MAKEILHSMRLPENINKMVRGLMIESYIEDGNQKPDGGVYGKSITDPCLGWEKTERLIYDIASLRMKTDIKDSDQDEKPEFPVYKLKRLQKHKFLQPVSFFRKIIIRRRSLPVRKLRLLLVLYGFLADGEPAI